MRTTVGLIAGAVVVVHLIFLQAPLIPDEAGYYLVGKDLSFSGPNLYGHYWVDRPPGLIAINALAAASGHLVTVRVLAALSAAGTVVLLAIASYRSKGSPALVAAMSAALLCAPTLETLNATGEMFAAPWIALSFLCVIAAVSPHSRRPLLLACGAGVAGTIAMSIKQNMLDGAVFAAAVIILSVGRREMPLRAGLRLAAAGLAGALIVLGAMVAFALATPAGVSGLWEAVVGFRAAASQVLFHSPPWDWFSLSTQNGNIIRFQILMTLAVLSGIIPAYFLLAARAVRSRFRGSAVAWAAALCLV
ncbi:MAG: hypothetical protein M3Y66_01760, partial [Actinomycetota bacterium]|nr:hypothetical protein [Actinomycetota bacterium]